MVKLHSINRRGVRNLVRQPVSKIVVKPGLDIVEHVAASSVIADAYEDRTDKLLQELEHLKFVVNNQRQAAMWAAEKRDEDRNLFAQVQNELNLHYERERKADSLVLEYQNELNMQALRINSQQKTIEEQQQRIEELIEERDHARDIADEYLNENLGLQRKLTNYELVNEYLPASLQQAVRPRNSKHNREIESMMTFDDGEHRRKKGQKNA